MREINYAELVRYFLAFTHLALLIIAVGSIGDPNKVGTFYKMIYVASCMLSMQAARGSLQAPQELRTGLVWASVRTAVLIGALAYLIVVYR